MDTRVTAPNATNSPEYRHRWIALLFICISLLVIGLDVTVLNVALPSISSDLNARASELQWIVDAYAVIFAALLLTWGAISDRIGRKKALQIGLVWFGIGSTAAAFSASTEMLIASRAFMGIGGAVIMPSTLSIITNSFPQHERAQAIAIWAAVFGLSGGLGPLISGALLEHYDWGAVFLINLPVIVIALAGGAFYITESRDENPPRLDLPGVLLSIPALFALVYAIIEAGETSWGDQRVLAASGAAVVLLGAFIYWERRYPDAMLPLHFFKNMSFTGANMAMVVTNFSLIGAFFFLSQYLQSVLGYTALGTGVRLLPLALTVMVVAALSARVADRLGTKLTVASGLFIAGLGFLCLSQIAEVDTPYSSIGAVLAIFGLGVALTVSPATNSIMQSVPLSRAGIASAMNDTTRLVGSALGIAVLGTIMNSTYIAQVADLKTELALLPEQASKAIESSIQAAHGFAAGLANNPKIPASVGELIRSTASEAFTRGMNDALVVGAAIMFAASFLTIFILPARVQRPES